MQELPEVPEVLEAIEGWVEQIGAGDRRAVARAISAVESGDAIGIALVKRLFPKGGKARVIGVTGSPGAGKSTLVEKLAAAYRRAHRSVGIIAVDPTSPFSGGAILGDRIRMQSLSADEGVYIRSMATRGQLGGLAPTAHDVVTILDAAGCDVVLVETVGVGQDEVEVVRLADATLLMLVPGMGDDVQAFKAGVMEIGDVFVINKADRPGADRLEQQISTMLSITPRPDGWCRPVIQTVATTGSGVGAVHEALENFFEFAAKEQVTIMRRREKWRARLLDLLRQTLFQKVVTERLPQGVIDARVDEVLNRRRDPHSLVEEIIRESAVGHGIGKDRTAKVAESL
jgi:LAO/AO transport system kinase